MVNTDTGSKDSNPACQGKGNTGASKSGGSCHLSCRSVPPWCIPVLAKETSRKPRSHCPSVPGSRAGLHTFRCIWAPCTFPKLSFSRKSWGSGCCAAPSPSLSCTYQAVTKHLTSTAYALCLLSAFHPCGRTNQPPVSLSFHLLFLSHNVKSLRLQILTGNVSLQTERVSITHLMFH